MHLPLHLNRGKILPQAIPGKMYVIVLQSVCIPVVSTTSLPPPTQLAVMEGEDEGSLAALSEDYYEIDPLEKEWMLATAQGDLDRIHRYLFWAE